MVVFDVCCLFVLPSRELTYPVFKALLNTFEDDFPFPQVGYVNSLEGTFFGLFPRIEENPEEADFFFVPIYAACVMTKEKKQADESRFLATKAASKTPRW